MIGLWIRMALIAALALVTAPACGGKKKDDGDQQGPKTKWTKKAKATSDDDDDDVATPPTAKPEAKSATLTPGTMGIKRPTSLSYRWGRGAAQFKRCAKAFKKKDWAGAQKSCEAAIAKDSRHLSARYLLAQAMAQQGAKAGIAEHLSQVLAADWIAYGPKLADEPGLAKYFATAEGRAVLELNKAYQSTFISKAKAGILLLGRRGKHTKPAKPGRQWSSPRAEVFSYDLETKRYLRITDTKQSVAGFILSPSGNELAYFTYAYLDWPKSEKAPVLIGAGRVGVIDFETMTRKSEKDARLSGYFRRVELEFAGGDEIVVSAFKADGADLAPPITYSLDRGASKLARRVARADRKPGHLVVMFEAAWVERGDKVAGVEGSFPAQSFTLTDKKVTVTLLEDEQAAAGGLRWAPNKAHLLVSTAADPCDGNKESSIYLANATSGKLRHLLRGASRWDARWIDNDKFIYESPKGGLRIYDIAKSKHIERLHSYGGLGLNGIGGEEGPVCLEGGKPGESSNDEDDEDDED